MTKRLLLLLLSFIFSSAIFALAQDKPDFTAQAQACAMEQRPETAVSEQAQAEAQKATQNPVANLISVPQQNTAIFNIGPYNRTQDVVSFNLNRVMSQLTNVANGGNCTSTTLRRFFGRE